MTLIDATSRFRVPEFDLHDRLAKARSNAGITQDHMAAMLGCSRRTIVRYEATGTVPRSVVLAYHVATSTDLQWLETGVPSTSPVGPDGFEPPTSSVEDRRFANVIMLATPRPRKMAKAS